MESVTCLLLEYFIAENPPSKSSQRTIWVEMFDRLPEAENLLLVNTCNPLLLKDFDNPTYSFPLGFPLETLVLLFGDVELVPEQMVGSWETGADCSRIAV